MSLYGIDFYTGKRTPIVDDIGEVRYGSEQLPAAERERYFLTSDSFFRLVGETDGIYCATENNERLERLKKEVPGLRVLWHNVAFALVQLTKFREKGSMMKIREDFLPLNRPSIGETEIAGVTACLRSQWITTGPLCKTFEEQFQVLTGARHAVSLSYATAGMHLVLTALGIGPGDEVITPSLTFASTVNMIALHGARPVFADIHYDTLNINADDIEAKSPPGRRRSSPSILPARRRRWIGSWGSPTVIA